MTIQALYALAKAHYDKKQHKAANRTFEGETRFNDFMATKSKKDVEKLLNSEVHLAKLKHYLEEYKVGFTYHQKDGTTYLFFENKKSSPGRKGSQRYVGRHHEKPRKVGRVCEKGAEENHTK